MADRVEGVEAFVLFDPRGVEGFLAAGRLLFVFFLVPVLVPVICIQTQLLGPLVRFVVEFRDKICSEASTTREAGNLVV